MLSRAGSQTGRASLCQRKIVLVAYSVTRPGLSTEKWWFDAAEWASIKAKEIHTLAKSLRENQRPFSIRSANRKSTIDRFSLPFAELKRSSHIKERGD